MEKHAETDALVERRVSLPRLAWSLRGPPEGLEPLLEGADCVVAELGGRRWALGASPAWCRRIIGGTELWADIDIVNLGLGGDPAWYAMGGLPGAPPSRHAPARRLAQQAGFANAPEPETIFALHLERALAVAPDLDLARLVRAFFLSAVADGIAGMNLDIAELGAVLDGFDAWSRILASPRAVLPGRWLPGSPARRIRPVLRTWTTLLGAHLDEGGHRLAGALARQVATGALARPEAIGLLATILFAGTEPPAGTALWALAQVAARTDALEAARGSAEAASALIWESHRVRPAVNYVVRRPADPSRPYRSLNQDTLVAVLPVAHRLANRRRGWPLEFTPSFVPPAPLVAEEFPGLGVGAHHCLGVRFGMGLGALLLHRLARRGLDGARVSLDPVGSVIGLPRGLPTLDRRGAWT